MAILQLKSITSGYGSRIVINDLSLTVGKDRIVAIIGHNGAGKSSVLKIISGALPLQSGTISFQDSDIGALDILQRIEMGISYIPQGNRVFTELTVIDNLMIRSQAIQERIRKAAVIDKACERFPKLRPLLPKRAGLLSGGERQMLAMAGALLLSPKVLLLDEPSLGLDEASRIQMFQTVKELRESSKLTIIIVEQRVPEVMKIADEFYALKQGRVCKHGVPSDLASDEARRQVLM